MHHPVRPLHRCLLLTLTCLLLLTSPAWGAKKKAERKAEATQEAPPPVDPAFFQELQWRNIGPFRGGRSVAVAGVRQDPMTFYFGSVGGGVWKTVDGGATWKNVTDGQLGTASVGAVAVAPSDPNVIYAGMGEACIRGVATAHGDGVYRSTDGGGTWEHLGLEATRHISQIAVHPTDPDRVYVAAQGNAYQPTPERGVYRSKDGGATWEKVLFVDEGVGPSDLVMDPTNPRVLYAGMWEHRRLPWKIESGGEKGGVYKTTDGGDTWNELGVGPEGGLPKVVGKIGVTVSPANPSRVWAVIEAEEGGVFRSDDGGKTFSLINSDRVVQTRSWYYMHIFADPQDAETVYVLNAPMLRSIDGGKTFQPVANGHGDNHALWIHPENSALMIVGNDGGAQVSRNAGESWSTLANQPTAQFYRVDVDHGFPYRLYGGQQDNSSVAITSWSPDGGIGAEDWDSVGGCESAHVAFDPDDPRYIYAGCYQGNISRYDSRTQATQDVMAYPVIGLGSVPSEERYRFNWNAPIETDPHDPTVIYHGAQKVLRSTDRGVSWTEISPDLTRNEKDKQGPGGGPITSEGAGGEIYGTLLYLALSPHEPGVIWTGSDDGLVHLTRDGGESWQNVTPRGLPEAMINAIEISPHDPATAYLAVTRYKFGDFTPHIYKTADYGKSWKRTVTGIPEESFVRVVREDPARRGLLYAGTETGPYVSFDDGGHWQPLQLDLPLVPITDLAVAEDDLVAATQGRAFWILDNLTPLRGAGERKAAEREKATLHLYNPGTVIRREGGEGAGGKGVPSAPNPPSGVVIDYYLAEDPNPDAPEEGDDSAGSKKSAASTHASDHPQSDEPSGEPDEEMSTAGKEDKEAPADAEVGTEVAIEILDASSNLIRRSSTHDKPSAPNPFGPPGSPPLAAEQGHNRWVWDLGRTPPRGVEGLWIPGALFGYRVPPGEYQVRLSVGDESVTETFQLVEDPRLDPVPTPAQWAEQQALAGEVQTAIDEVHGAINRLWAVKEQVSAAVARAEGHDGHEEIEEAGEALNESIDALVDELAQTRTASFQDIINYPNQLNVDFLWLLGSVDGAMPVTAGHRARFADLQAEWATHKAEHDRLVSQEVAAFNQLVASHEVPAVSVPAEEAEEE